MCLVPMVPSDGFPINDAGDRVKPVRPGLRDYHISPTPHFRIITFPFLLPTDSPSQNNNSRIPEFPHSRIPTFPFLSLGP